MIIFCATKKGCEELCTQLRSQRYHALSIHGDTDPRNPRHFGTIEGERTRVSYTLLTKTVFSRGAQPLFHALFGVKTLSGTLLGPAFNEKG